MDKCVWCGRPHLSPKEVQVIKFIKLGWTNKRIAIEMTISDQAVKNYLYLLFDKLGVQNRTELAMYAVNNGLKE
jgi:DNA-binding NarL/FixJ family response regulator